MKLRITSALTVVGLVLASLLFTTTTAQAATTRVCTQLYTPASPAGTKVRLSVNRLSDGRYQATVALDSRDVARVAATVAGVALLSNGRTIDGPYAVGVNGRGLLNSSTGFYVTSSPSASSEGSYIQGLSGRIYPLNYRLDCF